MGTEEKKDINRDKLNTIFVIIGKKVQSIASSQEEFNLLMEEVVNFVNSDTFSFGQLDIMFDLIQKKRPEISIRKETLMVLYRYDIIPCINGIKAATTEEERRAQEEQFCSQMHRFSHYVEVEKMSFNSLTSGDILDQIMPIKEKEFQICASEILEGVKNKLNERYNTRDTENER